MADGKSFFRGGTDNNTRLSSFNKNTVKGKSLSRSLSYNHENASINTQKDLKQVKSRTFLSKSHEQTTEPELDVTFTEGTQNSQPGNIKADNSTTAVTINSDSRVDPCLAERELTRLVSFLDESLINVPQQPVQETKTEEEPIKKEEPKKRSFYVEKWPEAVVRLDNTLLPFTRSTVSPTKQSTFPSIGGEPITIELAKELRLCVSGSTIHSLSPDWKKVGVVFQSLNSSFPYGLITPKLSGARGILLTVQAHILQRLLFESDCDPNDLSNLCPSESRRRQALIHALCGMCFKAGSRVEGCICLPRGEALFTTQPGYRQDGITERLEIFKFRNIEEMTSFMRRHIDFLTGDYGCLLVLYSIVLSRQIQRISHDQGLTNGKVEKLLTDMEGCSLSLINLLITGRGVRFLHNGLSLYDEFGHPMATPSQGIEERGPIGFLFYDKAESREHRTQVGSMLKTPHYPIWLTMVNGMMGLLFSTNPELVSHWRVEHRFSLHYYTGQPNQDTQTILSVDTRFNKRGRIKTALLRKDKEDKSPPLETCILTKLVPPSPNKYDTRFNKRGRIKTALLRKDKEDKSPPLETCILTKWFDAELKWNGTSPFY